VPRNPSVQCIHSTSTAERISSISWAILAPERFTPAFPTGARIDTGGLMLSSPSPGLFAQRDPAGTPVRGVPFRGSVRIALRCD
jgi:hypothetical protein